MKVIDPGHVYELFTLDGEMSHPLVFVKREGPGYPGNVGYHAGTNIQDVLRCLIDRVEYLNKQEECYENGMVISHLRCAFEHLEKRAAGRHGRVLGKALATAIEKEPFCQKCGHVECEGACHPEEL